MHQRVPSASFARAARTDDIASIAALAASVHTMLYDSPEVTEDDIRFIWDWPRFDLSRDAWIATAGDTVIGYAWVWGPRTPAPEYDSRLLLRLPDIHGEAAEQLLDQMEQRVLEKARAEPASVPPRLAIPCSGLDPGKQTVLEARGYRQVRTYFRMERGLEGTWSPAEWPEGMEVAIFRAGEDDRDLYQILKDSFSDHYRFMPEPFDDWRQRNIGHADFAPDLSFLVRHRGEAVAASANFRSDHVGSVGMLGVRRPWRRLGLGRALLLHSFTAFRDARLKTARLGVDAENADRAVALYESVGMTVARRDHLFERTLRGV